MIQLLNPRNASDNLAYDGLVNAKPVSESLLRNTALSIEAAHLADVDPIGFVAAVFLSGYVRGRVCLVA